MILIALALVQSQPVAEPPSAAPRHEEMVVLGQRLSNWRGQMFARRGSDHCRTLTSTGDAEIDQVGCSAMAQCYARHSTGFDQAAAQPRSSRASHPVYRQMGACVAEQRDLLLTALAERRYQARHGNQNASD